MTTATPTRPVTRETASTGKARNRARNGLLHIGLVIGGFAMVFPFLWMFITSFKTLSQLLNAPLSFLPAPWTVRNYVDAWNDAPFALAYFNSIYIAVLVVIGTLITAAMAGYAFARIKFRGNRALFVVFLATQMIPMQVTLIPFYFLMAKLGWVDSHLSLIVPAALANPFAVFLMRQFVLSLPKELEEAALVDGAGRWRIFWSIIMPNVRPGLGALAIIAALSTWNNFLLPLVMLNSQNLFTVPLLLQSFRGQFGSINYGLIMAASAVATIPMLIAFVIGQRRIINSMAASGLGGR